MVASTASGSRTEISRATAPMQDDRTAAAFSGREDGNCSLLVGSGDPPAARARLLASVGLGASDAVFMQQVHGAGFARVGSTQAGRGLSDPDDAIPEVDALITTDAGIGLVVLVADCVPVLLVAPGRGVAAVHAGRGGVATNIVGAVSAALRDATGVHPAELVALIGPAIGGCCYKVPASLRDEVADSVPAARATTSWGAPALDLPAGVAAQLRETGVHSIERVGSCTLCAPHRWFSHRAATGAKPERRWAPGRQAGVVRLRKSAPRDGAALAGTSATRSLH